MKIKLFLASFLTLFLELSLIRYVSSNVTLIGYFTNIILIATFFGSGIGFLLSKTKKPLFIYSSFFLLTLIALVSFFKVEMTAESPELIFFKPVVYQNNAMNSIYFLPLIFVITSLVFIPIGKLMAKYFKYFKALTAYSIDIIGALFGILAFSMMSYFSLGPIWWFLVIGAIYIYLTKNKTYTAISILAILIIVFATNTSGKTWSPYYKIEVKPVENFGSRGVYELNANNLVHQYISTHSSRSPIFYTPFYFTPYKGKVSNSYKNVLIIGAGSGVDVATTLSQNPNIEHIDAVEIDPEIANFAKKLNPDKPYLNPKVTLHINDGRNFLENTNKKYDLIIFALTDSLVLSNNSSNIRLESFLFTTNSFKAAKERLTDNGLFTLYNFYREDWLIDKIAQMTQEVFGYPPQVFSYGNTGRAAAILTGPKILTEKKAKELKGEKQVFATDDWPFLYLKSKSIPKIYLQILAIVLAIIALPFIYFKVKKYNFKVSPRFFFLGVGFMLLETKSIATFSLLFGTTWIVNSLVIAAILSFVLIANLITTRIKINKKYLLVALISILTLNYFVSPSYFLQFSIITKYILASIFYFSPIFISNLIFSSEFRDQKQTTMNFGSNLLGATIGGILEYLSLVFGYRFLYIIIAISYILSMVKFRLRI